MIAILEERSPGRARLTRRVRTEGVAARVLRARGADRPPGAASPAAAPQEHVRVPPGASPP